MKDLWSRYCRELEKLAKTQQVNTKGMEILKPNIDEVQPNSRRRSKARTQYRKTQIRYRDNDTNVGG